MPWKQVGFVGSTCDNIGQIWVKVLEQVQGIVDKEEGIVMPKQHPLVVTMVILR